MEVVMKSLEEKIGYTFKDKELLKTLKRLYVKSDNWFIVEMLLM